MAHSYFTVLIFTSYSVMIFCSVDNKKLKIIKVKPRTRWCQFSPQEQFMPLSVDLWSPDCVLNFELWFERFFHCSWRIWFSVETETCSRVAGSDRLWSAFTELLVLLMNYPFKRPRAPQKKKRIAMATSDAEMSWVSSSRYVSLCTIIIDFTV